MLPYHPKSDALPRPVPLAFLPAEPPVPCALPDADFFFVVAALAIFFFSLLESFSSIVDFDRLELACSDDFLGFGTDFLGALRVGFKAGFGVVRGVAGGFGTGVSTGVGLANSISLFA